MIKTETIRNFYGKIIGYIEIYPNKNKILKDVYRKIIGRYDFKNNVTRDKYNRIIAKGDNLLMLLNAK